MKTGILSNFKGDLLGGITAGVIALLPCNSIRRI